MRPLLDDDVAGSPFASQLSADAAAGTAQQHPPAHAGPVYTPHQSDADADAAVAALEAGDDLQALPDATRSAASAASLRAKGPPAANGSIKSNPGSSSGKRRTTRKLIPLSKVCPHAASLLQMLERLAGAHPPCCMPEATTTPAQPSLSLGSSDQSIAYTHSFP